MIRNKVQLITYADSLGGSLSDLTAFVDRHLKDAVGGVHVLPFYPSSADRGFAPLTHFEVAKEFGTWEDIRELAEKYDLTVDLTVNHVSAESEYFKDYLKNGDASLHAPLFLDIEKLLQKYQVEWEAFSETYRPRTRLPYTPYECVDGTKKRVWTTFTGQQIDFDVDAKETRQLLHDFIEHLVAQGVKMIRLDAVGYCVKRPWTSSFLIPDTYEFMNWLRETTPIGVDLLAEVHAHPSKQIGLLEKTNIDWIYDFSLPLITLHTLRSGSTEHLKNWIKSRPDQMVTTLDTHDGIGVIDVDGLLPLQDIEETVAWIVKHGGNHAMRADGRTKEDESLYQVNCTYYSAVGEDDEAYLVARAIQFFIPGIPQVYYVGLLAGRNDHELYGQTKHGRDVNRHNYTKEELEEAVQQPVVQRLLKLMEFRSNHPAFQGVFTQKESDEENVVLRWEKDDYYCEADIDVVGKRVVITYIDIATGEEKEWVV